MRHVQRTQHEYPRGDHRLRKYGAILWQWNTTWDFSALYSSGLMWQKIDWYRMTDVCLFLMIWYMYHSIYIKQGLHDLPKFDEPINLNIKTFHYILMMSSIYLHDVIKRINVSSAYKNLGILGMKKTCWPLMSPLAWNLMLTTLILIWGGVPSQPISTMISMT